MRASFIFKMDGSLRVGRVQFLQHPQRDQPDVYDDYVTANLIRAQESQLPSSSDVVVICAASGPSDTDLQREAVDRAIVLLRDGGLLGLIVIAGDQRAGASPRWKILMPSVSGNGGCQ